MKGSHADLLLVYEAVLTALNANFERFTTCRHRGAHLICKARHVQIVDICIQSITCATSDQNLPASYPESVHDMTMCTKPAVSCICDDVEHSNTITIGTNMKRTQQTVSEFKQENKKQRPAVSRYHQSICIPPYKLTGKTTTVYIQHHSLML